MLKCTIAKNIKATISPPRPGRSWLKKRSTGQEMNFAIGTSQIWFYIRHCLQHNTHTQKLYLHAYLCTNTICVSACMYIYLDFRMCTFIVVKIFECKHIQISIASSHVWECLRHICLPGTTVFEKLLVKFMVVSWQPLGYTQLFLLVLLVVHEAQTSRVLEASGTKNKHINVYICFLCMHT